MTNKIEKLIRLPRGKCAGCDKIRIRYLARIWSGRQGFSDSYCREEALCRVCHPDIKQCRK